MDETTPPFPPHVHLKALEYTWEVCVRGGTLEQEGLAAAVDDHLGLLEEKR